MKALLDCGLRTNNTYSEQEYSRGIMQNKQTATTKENNKPKSLWWQIKNDFRCVKKDDPSFESKFEFLFNHPGVLAIVTYRISNRIYNRGFRIIARMLSGIVQIITNIDIHPACSIGNCVFIDHGFGVVIGQTAIIEDNVLIYQGATLGGVSLNKGKRHPTIKNGCVIGAGAKVLGNITIGENSKIGANSVVIKDVPPHSTAVGVPARIVVRKNKRVNQFDHNKLPDVDKESFMQIIQELNAIKKDLKENNITLKHSSINAKYNYSDNTMTSKKKG